MNISITLPDDVAEQMQARGCNLPRRALRRDNRPSEVCAPGESDVIGVLLY